MNIVSKPGPGTPVGKLAVVPDKASDTAEPLAQTGAHAHTSSLSSISGVSPSENLKATGGDLNVTGAFQSKELVSKEDREKILNGGSGSRGPMPGLMESIFKPAPTKVTIQPQRSPVARAWDSFAGGVKGFFKALGQRLTRSKSEPPSLVQKFDGIRKSPARWALFEMQCKNEFSYENVSTLLAVEKFEAQENASPQACREAFKKVFVTLYEKGATGDLREQEMVVNLPAHLQAKVIDAYNAEDGLIVTKAKDAVAAVKDEIVNLLSADTMGRFEKNEPELARKCALMKKSV